MMFNTICLKLNRDGNYSTNLALLVDTIFFYQKVKVFGHREMIVKLIQGFGEELLEELIKTERIELMIEENTIGSMSFPAGNRSKYNVNIFSADGETHDKILYKAHRQVIKNSSKNMAFSDKFAMLTKPFKYEETLINQIRNDFSNEDMLLKKLPLYVNSIVPNYEIPTDLSIEIIKDSSFGPFDA